MKNKSDAFFNLSNILIILAGFSFTLAGIFFTGYVATYNSSINTINNMILQHEAINGGKVIPGNLDFTYSLGNQLETKWKYLKFYSVICLIFGLFLTLWGLIWLFSWLSIGMGWLIFLLLKKIKFIRIEEGEVKAEVLVV